MASSYKLSDLVERFDGTGDVAEWIADYELATELREEEQPQKLLPLFLRGRAKLVWSQLDDASKSNFGKCKAALIAAFGADCFDAYARFVATRWTGEPPEVLMQTLRRLATLALIGDKPLTAAFVHALPDEVAGVLRATVKTTEKSPAEVVAAARPLLNMYAKSRALTFPASPVKIEDRADELVAVAAGGRRSPHAARKQHGDARKTKCSRCEGPHPVSKCKAPPPKRHCWTCGATDHFARNCPEGQGNGEGRQRAPADLPNHR